VLLHIRLLALGREMETAEGSGSICELQARGVGREDFGVEGDVFDISNMHNLKSYVLSGETKVHAEFWVHESFESCPCNNVAPTGRDIRKWTMERPVLPFYLRVT
jgi:hypothetical protein